MDARAEQDASVQRQAAMLVALTKLPDHEAAACSMSILLVLSSSAHGRQIIRTLLNEPVVREGFRGESMLTTLTRLAK